MILQYMQNVPELEVVIISNCSKLYLRNKQQKELLPSASITTSMEEVYFSFPADECVT